jgi:hypothetical protein
MTDPTMRVEGAGGSGAAIFSVETLTGLTSSIASLHVEIEKSLSSQGLTCKGEIGFRSGPLKVAGIPGQIFISIDISRQKGALA